MGTLCGIGDNGGNSRARAGIINPLSACSAKCLKYPPIYGLIDSNKHIYNVLYFSSIIVLFLFANVCVHLHAEIQAQLSYYLYRTTPSCCS